MGLCVSDVHLSMHLYVCEHCLCVFVSVHMCTYVCLRLLMCVCLSECVCVCIRSAANVQCESFLCCSFVCACVGPVRWSACMPESCSVSDETTGGRGSACNRQVNQSESNPLGHHPIRQKQRVRVIIQSDRTRESSSNQTERERESSSNQTDRETVIRHL